MHTNIDAQNCSPPGTFCRNIPHPGDNSRDIEKAVIMEHRFAFFYWMKWKNMLEERNLLGDRSPMLFTVDWHRDLAPINNDKKERLQHLDQQNLSDAINFVWARLDQTNDGHILSAAWLNLIGDIVLLQNTTGQQHQTFTDKYGGEHHVYEFNDLQRLQEFMLSRDDQHIFFDVDLDYFIHGKGRRYYSKDFSRYSDDEIRAVINTELPLFQHILPKIEGITLAQEPGYCGGIVNSAQIMNVLHQQLFDEDSHWLHLDS